MPVTMSGVASGMNTDAIIEKLLKVEARPIQQLEIRKKKHSLKKDALGALQKHLIEINDAAKELYGFRAAYNNKKALSSNESVLTAKADKNSDKGIRKIRVLKVATAHKIATDPVKENVELPAGKFIIEVNGEKHTIKFKGGKLKKFKDLIEDEASDLLAVNYINTKGNDFIVTLESKISGKKGEIKITGKKEFLKKLGLVDRVKGMEQSTVQFTFDGKYFSPYSGSLELDNQNGRISISGDGTAVSITGLLWREYNLPVETQVKGETVLTFSLDHKAKKVSDDSSTPRRIEVGPREKVEIKGIELEGYNVSRLRKILEKKKLGFDNMLGIGIVVMDGEKRLEKIYPITKRTDKNYQVKIGKDFDGKSIQKVIFYCNSGSARFGNARLITPIARKGELAPKNVIAKPQNARVQVDGIIIERDKNNDLNDIIKGVTVNLRRASKDEVSLTIDHDIETAVDKIKKFVEAYNKYLDFHRQMTKTGKAAKPGDYKKKDYRKGLFIGDSTITRLESAVRMTVNGAYPNRAENQIKLLTQLGVSTGAINSKWETIKSGKLVVDESELAKVIRENPEGVKMFFGSDRDGDNKVDTGMAYRVEYVLKPYVSSGKNIIVSKISLEDSSIQMANERITKHEEHIKKYEERLRKKFARMEQALSESNAQKSWMNNQFGGGGKDNKK